ncbi:MAG: sigma-E processing peptidase SpoIIGA [Clostridia bacterium]|nr:sigma-E processing peptidase SpoIIGA [Clostridia bacterium]
MVYTVYLDVLFVLDFIIDYLILYSVGKVCGGVILRWRLVLSAVLGAVFSVISLLLPQVYTLPFMLFSAYVMVGISFGFKKWKLLLVFFGISAAFGGMVFAVGYITGRSLVISLKTLAIATVASYIIMVFAFKRRATGTTKREQVKVKILHKGKKAEFYALVDSGNTLCDPITNTPVLIAELDAVYSLFEDGILKTLKKCQCDQVILKGEGMFRPIPFTTVGGRGILPAFKGDMVTVNGKERHVLIGVSRDKLAGEYMGIIGLEEE